MNVNVPSEVIRPDGESGAVTIRLMGGRGVRGRSGDEKVTPPSLPASQGSRANLRSLAHSPFWKRGIPDTPTNQSGLGAIIETSVTSGCVWLISKSAEALPGDEPILPPATRRSAVPAAMAALISFDSLVVSPRSAMSMMPSLAAPPSRQKLTCAVCVAPMSGEKWADEGNSSG